MLENVTYKIIGNLFSIFELLYFSVLIFLYFGFVVGEYIVTTYTGNVKDASTNAKVYIKFTGANGDSKEVELSKSGSVPFQQGGYVWLCFFFARYGIVQHCTVKCDIRTVRRDALRGLWYVLLHSYEIIITVDFGSLFKAQFLSLF